ncbi:GNAT family N-acetyltransferase [Mucisphaera calidilacus]|uniref:N-acetyltransferase domain-containing protein n=1 Tax=Mucisphaera calidilacus TaxID=2527982 RepID=A0A518C0N2_9BACT|nr:GNAT family N-acetyltransferase [Mucisphaera calidilacus]QDU72771.1 hypothetical protein Pan265_26450 [Mucisphaera calidilacus]
MTTTTLRQRFHNPAAHDNALTLTTGTWDHLRQLAPFHYRADKPATATRILALLHTHPSPADRWLARTPRPQPAAILVESLPALACNLRDHALNQRFGNTLPPAQRARLINQEIRCISRVIVHPRFRGNGLAVRLVRHALETATTPVTEALAAMGRINPFFQHAGMTPYTRPPLPCDQRLLDALEHAGFVRTDLARPARLWQDIQRRPPATQHFLIREVQRWYQQNAGRGGRRHHDTPQQLNTARTRVLVEPVYYAHINPQHAPQHPA